MSPRIFRAHLRRLFLSPNLYIAMVVYAVLLLLPCLTVSSIGGNSSMSMLNYTQSTTPGFVYFNATIIPALAYAVTYISDYETRLLYVWCIRGGTERYAVSYYLTALAGGFLTSFCGSLLFIGINLLRDVPVFGGFYGGFAVRNYETMYLSGQHTGLVLAVLTEYALGASALSGAAAAFSAIFHRKAAGLGVPIVFFFVFNMYKTALHPLLDPIALTWTVDYSLPYPHWVCKGLAFLVYAITFGLITVMQIKRSVENA